MHVLYATAVSPSTSSRTAAGDYSESLRAAEQTIASTEQGTLNAEESAHFMINVLPGLVSALLKRGCVEST